MASHTVSKGIPAFAPNIKPSPIVAALTNHSKLVSSLIVAPFPGSPTKNIFSPMTSNKGLCLSKHACLPPTKIDSRPRTAKSTALVTGASKKSTPLACVNCVSSLTKSTALVDVSMMVAPAFTWAMSPCSPNMTSRTCLGPGNEHMTTSAFFAPAAKLSAHCAPSAIKLLALSCETSNTVVGYPALIRLAAMGLPILPTPTKNKRGLDDMHILSFF